MLGLVSDDLMSDRYSFCHVSPTSPRASPPVSEVQDANRRWEECPTSRPQKEQPRRRTWRGKRSGIHAVEKGPRQWPAPPPTPKLRLEGECCTRRKGRASAEPAWSPCSLRKISDDACLTRRRWRIGPWIWRMRQRGRWIFNEGLVSCKECAGWIVLYQVL